MYAPPLTETSLAGAPPQGEAAAKNASTGGRESMVNASPIKI